MTRPRKIPLGLLVPAVGLTVEQAIALALKKEK